MQASKSEKSKPTTSGSKTKSTSPSLQAARTARREQKVGSDRRSGGAIAGAGSDQPPGKSNRGKQTSCYISKRDPEVSVKNIKSLYENVNVNESGQIAKAKTAKSAGIRGEHVYETKAGEVRDKSGTTRLNADVVEKDVTTESKNETTYLKRRDQRQAARINMEKLIRRRVVQVSVIMMLSSFMVGMLLSLGIMSLISQSTETVELTYD